MLAPGTPAVQLAVHGFAPLAVIMEPLAAPLLLAARPSTLHLPVAVLGPFDDQLVLWYI